MAAAILVASTELLAGWLQRFWFDFKLHLGTVETNIKFKEEVCLTQN
jgi:hypothetical protein